MAEQSVADKLAAEQAINERFNKAGTKMAEEFKRTTDHLDGKPAPVKETPKPEEKPRAADGKFAPTAKAEEKPVEKPKVDHIPALRDALAKAVGKEKAANDAVASLKAEMAEIKALLKQGVPQSKPVNPEEAQKVESEQRWVRERLMPEFQPVLDASRLILEERREREEGQRIASENLAKFESYANILDVSPEKRNEAAGKILSGEIMADTPDATFLLALKAVMGSGSAAKATEDEAAEKSRERSEAEKRAATGIMGRSAPVTETDTNDFQRKIADARKNKDQRTEDVLIAEELQRRLLPKFLAGHTTPAE